MQGIKGGDNVRLEILSCRQVAGDIHSGGARECVASIAGTTCGSNGGYMQQRGEGMSGTS